ncbi:MAG: glycosyltransferase family 4 protein [Deltaproteobacteria bacterium]|nr:glycosyltransferase family 4 protein [Deltaproteobacteria bacterium]
MEIRSLKNSVVMSMGPGQQVETLKRILVEKQLLKQFLQTYPDLIVESYENGRKVKDKKIKLFKTLQFFTLAVTNRLSYSSFLKSRDLLQVIKDRVVANHIEPSKVYIAWSFIGLESIKRAKKLGTKVILECQTTHIDQWIEIIKEEKKIMGIENCYSDFSEFLVRRVREEYEMADLVKVLSSYSKESFVKQGLDPKKVRVIPFGIEKHFAIPDKVDKEKQIEKTVILYVGRVEILKGIQYLLKSFSQIKGKDIELHLVGQVLPEAKVFLKNYQEDKRIKIFGGVSKEKLKEFYKNADIFVFPSLNDAFGLVVLEAMSFKLPIITTEHSCSKDVISDWEEGFVVPIRDSSAIKEKLELLIENKNLRQEMGERARQKVVTNFSIERYENETLSLLEELDEDLK